MIASGDETAREHMHVWRWPVSVQARSAGAGVSTRHRLLGLGIGIVVGGIYLFAQPGVGSSVLDTLWQTFSSPLGFSQVIQLATPLILAGAAVAVALRVGLWNIGVEGQLLMGAWAGTGVAFAAPDLPGALLVTLMVLAALVGGAVWVAVPALARSLLGVNEVITTLMLNFVAALWLVYWASGPWAADGGIAGGIFSRSIPSSATLPQFQLGAIVVGAGFFVAVGVALALGLTFRFTRWGLQTSLVGADQRTAVYAGVNSTRLQLTAFLLSGALGGLVGIVVELDQVHALSSALSYNTGYLGIVVAVLVAGSVSGTVLTGMLMAVLLVVGTALRTAAISTGIVLVITGIVMLCASLADSFARYEIRFTWVRRGPTTPTAMDEAGLSRRGPESVAP